MSSQGPIGVSVFSAHHSSHKSCRWWALAKGLPRGTVLLAGGAHLHHTTGLAQEKDVWCQRTGLRTFRCRKETLQVCAWFSHLL